MWDVKQGKLVRTMEGGSDPENFAVSQDGKTLFVSNEDASGMSFIDVASGKVTKTIKTGEEPEGVTVTPDGKRVYVTSEDAGTLTVVDIREREGNEDVQNRSPAAHDSLHTGRPTRLLQCRERRQRSVLRRGEERKVRRFNSAQRARSSQWAWHFHPMRKTLYVTTGRGHKLFMVDTATNKPPVHSR